MSDNAVSPVEVQLPDGLLEKMSANDWNVRNQAISELEKFILTHPSGLGSNITKVIIGISAIYVYEFHILQLCPFMFMYMSILCTQTTL